MNGRWGERMMCCLDYLCDENPRADWISLLLETRARRWADSAVPEFPMLVEWVLHGQVASTQCYSLGCDVAIVCSYEVWPSRRSSLLLWSNLVSEISDSFCVSYSRKNRRPFLSAVASFARLEIEHCHWDKQTKERISFSSKLLPWLAHLAPGRCRCRVFNSSKLRVKVEIQVSVTRSLSFSKRDIRAWDLKQSNVIWLPAC